MVSEPATKFGGLKDVDEEESLGALLFKDEVDGLEIPK